MFLEFFLVKKKVRELIDSYFQDENDNVLDLGAGDNPHYHDKIKGKIVSFDLKKTDSTHVVGDAGSVPFKKDSFDAVVSINSFYYFNNPFDSEKEISRVLKKKGKLFLMMPFMYPIHDVPFDKYRFTEYGIRKLFEKDFDIKELGVIGGIFNIKAVFFHSLIKGLKFVLPRPIAFVFAILLWPFYFLAQLISLLDFFDRTRRWPTYYYLVAIKK